MKNWIPRSSEEILALAFTAVVVAAWLITWWQN
jgi:hypothetical protein